MISRFLARMRAFLHRRRLEADLDAELQEHLAQEVARNLARGVSPDEAQRVARIAVGNLTTHVEDARAAVTGVWFEQLMQDVRYALRVLRRNPAFALVSILSLGFGIGATTTVFSTVDAVDFRPPPFREPHRLAFLAEVAPPTDDFCGGCLSRVSPATAIDWFAQVRSYDATGAMTESSVRWVQDDAIETLGVHEATPAFFRLLGVSLALGRDFLPGDTLAGAMPVVIVTHGFWLNRLVGDTAAIGRALPSSFEAGTGVQLRGATVIGVLPNRFRFTVSDDRQVWVPLRLSRTSPRTSRSLTVVARLRDGVSLTTAGAELRTIFARLAAEYPDSYHTWGASAVPLSARLDWGAGRNRRLLFGITGLVLLIAVVNVAGLLAGRTSVRRQEFAMRSAFGASHRRLLRQLLVEGTSIGLAGGVSGALVAFWGIHFSSSWFRVDSGVATMDVRVLAFALVLSIVVGIITALGPALRIAHSNLVGDFRGRGIAGSSRRAGAISSAMIIAQIALGLVLLTAAASLSIDFIRLRYTDIGFDPSGVYETSISIPGTDGKEVGQWRAVAEDVRARIASIPGLHSATLAYRSAIHPEIIRPADGERLSSLTPVLTAVESSYFTTWGMRLVRGRPFGASDNSGAAMVAIVNQSAASRFWPGQEAVGRQLFLGDSGAPGELLTVVGMSVDVERGELKERHWPMVYRPLAQATIWHAAGALQVRIANNADRSTILATAQSRVRESLQRPANPFESAEAKLDRRLQARRLNAIALVVFSVFGLALAAMGVYGSIGAAVTRRTREIGVRIALGAAPAGTLRLIVRRGIVTSLTGVVLGLPGAGVLARVLRSQVAGTDVLDPRLFIGAAMVMILTAGVAAWLPARRVLRVDPVDALRAD